ncbi:MAG TPA: sugar phosphate isomerase/epimerase [Tepidisphaeraceae bacterium]|nr:sugar phosphate isomerase/epimerase [Tepidisphaeraceae bacterium]
MARPVTLFTGQWADLSLEEICKKASGFGYDGLELACWGDHFEVDKALKDRNYCKGRWEILSDFGLTSYSISAHLVGQATCDRIDERHKAILPPEVWGNGDPEGVRKRAARRMIDTAKAARKLRDAAPGKIKYPMCVNGFTGSSIWHALYAFPPTDQKYLQGGFDDFARRWVPILNEFEKQDVNFALEVHPTEIAFDIVTAERAIAAVKGHKRFGFNYDPSHLGYQHVDYVRFIYTFSKRIFHCHIKDAWWDKGDGTVGVFGGHTTFADARRYWDFRSPGHGDIDFERIIVALNDIGYTGPLSVEWEDSRMNRDHGARESCELVRQWDFEPSKLAFDAQFDR